MSNRIESEKMPDYENRRFKVSAVIPTKNRPEDLMRCLESLCNQSYPIDEIVVVDASHDDCSEKICRRLLEGSKIKLVYVKQRNGGLASARNIGNRLASGDLILNLEDDVILHRDFVKEVVAIFAKDLKGEVGGVGGKIEEGYGGARKKPLDFLYTIFGLIFFRDSPRKGSVTIAGHHSRFLDKLSYVDWILNAAYRKEVFRKFSYDENLEKFSPFAYYDDFDFSYSVSRVYKLVLNPKARLIHKTSFKAHSHESIFVTNSVKIQNHYYLVKKHGFSEWAFWWSTFGLLIAHVLLSIKDRDNILAFRGLIDGIKRIINNSNQVYL